jgi:hypothetical protein
MKHITIEREALKLAIQSLESCSGVPHWPAICATIVTIKQALAAQAPVREDWGPGPHEYHNLPAPVQRPVMKKRKWVLHKSFADVAGFDEDGIPSFYWQESVTKFKSGELSVPCKGKNCGSMNGWLHSAECRAEHEAQYTTPPAAPVQEWMKPHPKCDEGCLFQCTKGFTQFPECATTPPAPAVPDALNPKDENPAYAAGWNDCRAEMLKARNQA